MKGVNKAVIAGVVVIVLAAVCLCGVLGLVVLADAEPTITEAVEASVAEIVAEAKPTRIPTNTPVKPLPTKVPVYNTECKTLKNFETVITVVSGMTPNFQSTNVGVWDLAWTIEEYGGTYGIMLTEKNGCLEMAGSVSVFFIDIGDVNLAGSMSGMVAGYFSESETGIDWLQNEMINECVYATTQHSASRMMDDGTLWEVICQADYTDEMLSIGMTIYPK
jgi:hypothetical protein